MRGLASTIALVVVLAGLGGYIYFVELKKPAEGPDTKPRAFEVASDQIEEIEIAVTGGDKTHLQKVDKDWKIVEPVKSDAETIALTNMTTSLSGLDIQRVVNENAADADLAQYGLNPPKVDVSFRAKGQKDFRHILIGDKTTSGGDVFAKKADDKKVFLVSGYLNDTFNRTAFDLRDKMILKFDREKADTLQLTKGATTLEFHRQGSDWSIVKPAPLRADYSALEAAVTNLSTTPMQKVVTENATDLKQYGLDKPTVVATVTTGTAHTSLLLGKTEGDWTYAKSDSGPAVYTVSQQIVNDLSKDLGNFRRKDLFDMRSFTADHVDVKRGGDTFTLDKVKGKDGKDTWHDAAGKDVDTTKVEDLLGKLSALRAQSFDNATNPALKMPAIVVTARFDDKKMETVTVARAGNDVVASRADEPGTAKLEGTGFDDVMKSLDALK